MDVAGIEPVAKMKTSLPRRKAPLRGRDLITVKSFLLSMPSVAARKLKAANACLPWCCVNADDSVDLVVLVDVPERAVVSGINVHRGVVTPARVDSYLDASAGDNASFTQCHLIERIESSPAG